MRSAIFDILRTRGFRGLYAGLSPTLVEIIPYAGLQFGTYDTFKRWCMVRLLFFYTSKGSFPINDWYKQFMYSVISLLFRKMGIRCYFL